MEFVVNSRSGKPVFGPKPIREASDIRSLKAAFCQTKKSLYPDRVAFSIKGADGKPKTLKDEDLVAKLPADGNQIVLTFKDLGPQIGWTTVFFWEYLGPLVGYAMLAFYHGINGLQDIQKTALLCWIAHYAKRILETFFVHRFSHGTMPIFNLFKNCGYYWGFGAFCGYFANHSLYTAPGELQQKIGLAIFIISELSNGYCHIILRNLRAPGSKERKIPRGFLFEFVSCPNYTFEILAWIGFSIMTQTFAVYVFTFVGFAQMFVWAKKKHAMYRKDFNGVDNKEKYPSRRKILIPFLL